MCDRGVEKCVDEGDDSDVEMFMDGGSVDDVITHLRGDEMVEVQDLFMYYYQATNVPPHQII
jgi:hypothetical protein